MVGGDDGGVHLPKCKFWCYHVAIKWNKIVFIVRFNFILFIVDNGLERWTSASRIATENVRKIVPEITRHAGPIDYALVQSYSYIY